MREVGLDHASLAQSESLFALSNGHIGMRGNLDEGDPNGLPGTYLNSFYETRPLPYAEAGYGYPESGQTVLNVTNGKLIRLLVDDEPLDLRYGTIESARAGARPAPRRARTRAGVALAGRRPGAAAQHPVGVAAPAARSWPSATASSRSTRRCGWSCSRSWSPTSRLPAQSKDPRVDRGDRERAGGGRARRRRHCARCSCTAPARASCSMAAMMDHVIDAARGRPGHRDLDAPGLGPVDARRPR